MKAAASLLAAMHQKCYECSKHATTLPNIREQAHKTAWMRQKGRRACRRGGLRAGGAGRGGHAGDVHEAIRECMQKVADLLGAELADLLAERAGGLAEQELPGARSHDAQGERLKRQC